MHDGLFETLNLIAASGFWEDVTYAISIAFANDKAYLSSRLS